MTSVVLTDYANDESKRRQGRLRTHCKLTSELLISARRRACMNGVARGKEDRRTLYERHDIRGVAWGVRELKGAEGLSDGECNNFRVVAGNCRRVLGDLRVERIRAAQGVVVILGKGRDLREISGKVDGQSQDRHSRRH